MGFLQYILQTLYILDKNEQGIVIFLGYVCCIKRAGSTLRTLGSLEWLVQTVRRGEEGQPHQSLVRTTFSSFSRPNHIVLSILFFLSVRSLKINTFFKNMATLGHRWNIKFSQLNFRFVWKWKCSINDVLQKSVCI